MRTGSRRARRPATGPRLRSRSPARLRRAETQGQQCAHGQRSHPLWKRCPPPPAPSQRRRAEKDSRYTRAGGLLCVAVIHGRRCSSSLMVFRPRPRTLGLSAAFRASDPGEAFKCKDHLRFELHHRGMKPGLPDLPSSHLGPLPEQQGGAAPPGKHVSATPQY